MGHRARVGRRSRCTTLGVTLRPCWSEWYPPVFVRALGSSQASDVSDSYVQDGFRNGTKAPRRGWVGRARPDDDGGQPRDAAVDESFPGQHKHHNPHKQRSQRRGHSKRGDPCHSAANVTTSSSLPCGRHTTRHGFYLARATRPVQSHGTVWVLLRSV